MKKSKQLIVNNENYESTYKIYMNCDVANNTWNPLRKLKG
jgi:hypothetical protein